jgi:hypothetical protein
MVFVVSSPRTYKRFNSSKGGLTYRQLEAADFHEFSSLLSEQERTETAFKPIFGIMDAEQRIRAGELCFICEDRGKIIAYEWTATKKKYILEINCTIKLGSNEAYNYNAYVAKGHRGGRVINELHHFGNIELMNKGFKKMIAARMNWNESVEQSMKRAGFNRIGIVTTGFFLTFRYMIRSSKSINLVNHGKVFEFYHKLFRKLIVPLKN